jgi:hypothetical protein
MFSYNADNTEPNKYSGYVYDAVWLYALALDTLIRNGGPADSVQLFGFFVHGPEFQRIASQQTQIHLRLS